MAEMFQGIRFTSLDISHFNTSNVTNMSKMFKDMHNLASLDLSHFNTSKVTNMYEMFYNNYNLTSLNVTSFDTSNVTTMNGMFDNYNGTSLDISGFNTLKVTDMSNMFKSADKLKTIYVGDKWTTSVVTSSTDMFVGCSSIFGGLGTTYNSSYIDKTYARIDNKPSSPGYFSTKATYTISYVLNGGTVSGSNPTSLDYGASTTLIVPTKSGYKFTGWTVSSGLLSGNTFTMGTSNVTITANFVPLVVQAIYSATDNSLTFINDVAQTKGGTYNGKEVTEVYTGFTTNSYDETTVPWYSYRSVIKKVDFIDEVKPTSLANWFRGFSSCTEINLKKLNTVNTTSLYHTFEGMSSLTSLDVSHFDTSKVTNMSSVFKDCSKITTLDLSNWNTSKVTGIHVMFSGMTNLTMLNISNFNTSNVTNMSSMFQSCSNLTSLDLSSFNTSKVTNMAWMFNVDSKLKTIYVSDKWTTSAVTDSKYMLSGISSIVGGMGTTYNSSYIDKTYARIDATGAPGYFTYKASS